MIKAINVANKNKNLQNNVNFEGKGKIINAVPYKLTEKLVGTLKSGELDFPTAMTAMHSKTKAEESIWRIFGPLSQHLGTSIEKLQKYWAGLDFAQASSDILDIRQTCIGKEHCDRRDMPAIVIAATPWKGKGSRGKIGNYKEELTEYLTQKLGIVSRKGTFQGVPLKSVTVVGGSRTIPNDYRRVANQVIIEGANSENLVLENSKFHTVAIKGVNSPKLQVADAYDATISESQIGSFNGRQLWIGNSSINQKVSTEKWLNVTGNTELGEVKAGSMFTCHPGSDVRINGDAIFSHMCIEPSSKVVISGAIINPNKQPNIRISEGSSLSADEVYANYLSCPKGAKFEANIIKIKDMPFRVALGHEISKIKRWYENLLMNSIESATLNLKLPRIKDFDKNK